LLLPHTLSFVVHRKRLEELVRRDCLLFARISGQVEWQVNGPSERVELGIRSRFLASIVNLVKQAAIEGLGIASQPEPLATQDIKPDISPPGSMNIGRTNQGSAPYSPIIGTSGAPRRRLWSTSRPSSWTYQNELGRARGKRPLSPTPSPRTAALTSMARHSRAPIRAAPGCAAPTARDAHTSYAS
jgi:hypothetical protein